MEKRLYLTQTTTTARSQLRSWSRRCVQGDFTLGTLTDQSPLQVLQLILLTTILKATWQICQWEVEVVLGSVWVGVVAWTDRVEMVEPRVLVANPSNIWISAILFGIPNCSIPCATSGNSSRIGKLQQSKDWPGKGRRKRMPRNTSNLLASVLTNLLIIKIVFYYRSGHFFLVTDPCYCISTWSICIAQHCQAPLAGWILNLEEDKLPKETTWSPEGGVDLQVLQSLIQLLQSSDLVRPFNTVTFLFFLLALDFGGKCTFKSMPTIMKCHRE